MYTRLFAEGEGSNKNATAVPPQGDKAGSEKDGAEQQPMIPKSRLDEVLERARVAEEKLKARDAADAKRQKEEDEKNGNWQKLAEQAAKERDAANTELKEARRYNSFLSVAAEAGIIDPEFAYKALPAVNDAEKMDDLVADLVKQKPYLIESRSAGAPQIASGGTKPLQRPTTPSKSLTEFIRDELNR